MREENPQVTFVCVGNRVRSVFAEFFLADLLRRKGGDASVSSAGFVPQVLKDHLDGALIPFPTPFYGRPMSERTREALLDKGITAPKDWRSKGLSPEMVEDADLIITALGVQKEDLCRIYQDACHKIVSIREASGKKKSLFSEDFSALPLNQDYWYFAEEEPKYVSEVLREWEATLVRAIPTIFKRLGITENTRDTDKAGVKLRR